MITFCDEHDQVVHNAQEEATTVEELFKQALKESSGRGKPMELGSLLKGVHEGNPHEKKTVNKNHEDDLCTLCLHGRAWDLVLEKVFDADGKQKDEIIEKLVATYQSKLCDVEDVKRYYKELKEKRPTKSQGGKKGEAANIGGALNDVVVMYQNVPKAIRFILYNNKPIKFFTFNKRKAIIKHLLTELPVDEVQDLWNFVRPSRTKMTVREVSKTQNYYVCIFYECL